MHPHTAYRVGLVAQTLTDASPDGLTVDGLERRTLLRSATLAHVLRVSVALGHVRREGARYHATSGRRVIRSAIDGDQGC